MTTITIKNLLAFTLLAVSTCNASPLATRPMSMPKRDVNSTDDDFSRVLGKRAPAQVFTSCTQPNVIALTFDDGPYQWHERVSQELLSAGARGTFFVNGNNYGCIYSQSLADQLLQSFRDGHQIASHTWSHPHLNTLSAAQQADQLTRVDTALQKIVGVKPAFMRPPYGEFNDQFRNVAGNNGQSIVTWDLDSGDSVGASPQQSEQSYDARLSSRPNNLLALNHETIQTTVDVVLPYVLNKYKNSGYRFVTVAECLGMSAYVSQGSPQARDGSWNCN